MAIVALICAIAWYCLATRTLSAVLVSSAITGALASLLLKRVWDSALAGLIAGAIGAGLLVVATTDTTGLLVERGIPALETVVVGVTVSAVCAALCSVAGSRWLTSQRKQMFAGACLALTVVTWFVVFTFLVVAPHLTNYDSLAKPGSYGYDASLYLQTYQYMRTGDGYYRALVKAGADDLRLRREGAVKNGVFVGWAPTVALVRQPTLFYFWKYSAPSGGDIVVLSIFVSGLVLAALYWAVLPRLGTWAALVPIVLFPQMASHAVPPNAFMPDWWAALAVCLSVVCLIRGRIALTMVLALIAALFRDIAALWLAVLVIGFAAEYLRKRAPNAGMSALASLTCVALFGAVTALHYRQAASIVSGHSGPGGGLAGIFATSMAHGFDERFIAPASYLMDRYEFQGTTRAVLLLPVGLLGLLLVGRGSRGLTLWLPAIYLASWMAFAVAIGPHSVYWGQHWTLLAVIGCGVALAYLGQWISRA